MNNRYASSDSLVDDSSCHELDKSCETNPLQAAITKGFVSGISHKTVEDVLDEARLVVSGQSE